MNFTIEKDVFLKGLARVQGIVEKRNTIPVLSNERTAAKRSKPRQAAENPPERAWVRGNGTGWPTDRSSSRHEKVNSTKRRV